MVQTRNRLDRSVDILSLALLGMSGLAIFIIALAGFLDVAGSYFFDHPLVAVFEMTELLLVLVVMMAQPFVLKSNSHISLDLLPIAPLSALGRGRRLVTLLLAILCYGTIAYASWSGLLASWTVGETTSGSHRLPVWPVKFALVVSAGLATAIAVLMLFSPPEGASPEIDALEGL